MDVWARISHPEDGLTERKPERAGERDFKETLVAFANAVPQAGEGILFIGVSDDGSILGCNGIESLQKTINRISTNDCYPPIAIRMESRVLDGKAVLAVIVPHSVQRPHFSGHAYRRVGNQNQKADASAYADFIVARSSVGAKILEHRGKVVTVRTFGKKLGDPKLLPSNFSEHGQFLIQACDPHTVTLQGTASHRIYVEQLENFSVSADPSTGNLLLIVRDAHR